MKDKKNTVGGKYRLFDVEPGGRQGNIFVLRGLNRLAYQAWNFPPLEYKFCFNNASFVVRKESLTCNRYLHDA
jgi:hypothetical protein